MSKISIQTGDISLIAELNDSETANSILKLLPITGTANVWGDEIYFSIPLHIQESAVARQEVEVGDLGYWPAGNAFCIFFGPTPVSTNQNPKAYSPVNVFGRIKGDATVLKKVANGDEVKVSAQI
jgi:hypothetical protein